jgi:hypothetical protein
MVVEYRDFVGMHRAKHISGMKLVRELVVIVEMGKKARIRSIDFAPNVGECR